MSKPFLSLRRSRILFFCCCLSGVLLVALWPRPPAIPYLPAGSAQHAAAFVVLTLAARACWPAARWPRLFAGLAGFGLAIEVLQGLIPTGRSPQLVDWLTDCAAISAGLAVIGLMRKVRGVFRASPDQALCTSLPRSDRSPG